MAEKMFTEISYQDANVTIIIKPHGPMTRAEALESVRNCLLWMGDPFEAQQRFSMSPALDDDE